MPIYGIYGGNDEELSNFKKTLKDLLFDFYEAKCPSEWKWKNFDLVLLDWYRDVGKYIDFDMAYTSEWDLLIFGSVQDIYSHINDKDVGLTGLIPLSKIENTWFWTTAEPHKSEWKRLFTFISQSYQYISTPLASLGPGLCFPKSFLCEYNELYIPELCHDELRMPLIAQLLHYNLKDTGFFKDWFNKGEYKIFNCDNQLIELQTITEELKAKGRKVFHPYRGVFDLNTL